MQNAKRNQANFSAVLGAALLLADSAALAQPACDPAQTWLVPDGSVAISRAIALSGGTLAVHRWLLCGPGCQQGMVDVFGRPGIDDEWTLRQTITAPDGNDQSFGWSIAISGDTMVIGRPFDDVAGNASGSAYVFVRTGCDQWDFQQKLTPTNGAANDGFGDTVAAAGDTIVIGASGADYPPPGPTNRGSAYVFARSKEVWSQRQEIIPPAEPAGSTIFHFGDSLTMSCGTLVIGAPFSNLNGVVQTGVAHVYTVHNGVATFQQKLVPSFPTGSANFGQSVSMNGDTILIGAPNNPSIPQVNPTGVVYAFVRQGAGGAWVQQARLFPDVELDTQDFGWSVALRGDHAIIGAPEDINSPSSFIGSAYVFEHSGSAWTQQQKILPPDRATIWRFGWAVAAGAGESIVADGIFRLEAYDCPLVVGTESDCESDRDGDAIPDDWEISGVPYIDASGHGQRYLLDLDLDGMSDADPNRKDIFVEVDALAGFAPQPAGIQRVIDAFAAAPNDFVNNPGCEQGIALHVLIDETNLPFSEWTLDDVNSDGLPDWPTEFSEMKMLQPSGTALNGYFGTVAERSGDNAGAIREARRAVFRYCIFVSKIDTVKRISGIGETPGNDFIVGMGWWTPVGGTADQQAGTFMHELGHTLGLHHGGVDEINYKPNYHSVMNYMWNYAAPWRRPGSWPLDPGGLGFSQDELPALDEASLDDCSFIVPPGEPTMFNYAGVKVPHNVAPPGKPGDPVSLRLSRIDLPFDYGGTDECNAEVLEIDVNRLKPDLPPSPGETLFGHTDWINLQYGFTDNAWFNEFEYDTVEPGDEDEPTFELYQEIATMFPPFCSGEIDGNGAVDVDDLIAVILSWGGCPSGCLADIAPVEAPPNGQVDVDDLIAVILAWGPCPQ
jgi:hypothetical protein